jgi:hypothetical protein
MPRAGDDDLDYAERAAAHADIHRDAWKRTLGEMEALADERRDDGWQVVTIAAGHTAPEPEDAGDTDRFGFVHVIPDNEAEPFQQAFERGEFPEYQVYRRRVEGRVFLVTELRDPDSETAILIAGNFELQHAPGLVRAAEREGELYTHVQTLDKTYLGSFRHDDWEKFFPDPGRVKEFSG